jgi:hypothetical protein
VIKARASACSVGLTFLKDDPSAQTQWTNTMLGLVCFGIMEER